MRGRCFAAAALAAGLFGGGRRGRSRRAPGTILGAGPAARRWLERGPACRRAPRSATHAGRSWDRRLPRRRPSGRRAARDAGHRPRRGQQGNGRDRGARRGHPQAGPPRRGSRAHPQRRSRAGHRHRSGRAPARQLGGDRARHRAGAPGRTAAGGGPQRRSGAVARANPTVGRPRGAAGRRSLPGRNGAARRRRVRPRAPVAAGGARASGRDAGRAPRPPPRMGKSGRSTPGPASACCSGWRAPARRRSTPALASRGAG